jgi:cytosine/adenosine deaminase-related metal-dependent hydrolase
MGTILIKNAKAVVCMDAADRVLENAGILVRDNYIAQVGPYDGAADEVIEAGHLVVYPGLINTHHHLFQTFTRNLPPVQGLELFDWLRALYRIWRRLTPDMVYYASLTGMGELLKWGCTTCFDHHYVFPRGRSADLIDRQFQAAADLGIRFHASRGGMSRGESDGGLPPDDLVQGTDEILADSLRLIEKYHDPGRYAMRQVALAPCSPFSVTGDLLVAAASLARDRKVRLHTHLAETRDEEQYCLARYGRRPLDYMEEAGWLGEDVWFAHGIHFNGEELVRLAATGTGVAHCPVSNLKLASGTANLPRMLELGVPVGLAVDGSASNDCSNLLAEIRAAYLAHRPAAGAPDGYSILKTATTGGARLLGRPDLGSIAPGQAADLFAVDTRRLEFVGTGSDPRSLPAVVGVGGPVALTMVQGRIVVRHGELRTVDEARVVDAANRLVEKLVREM